MEVLTKNREIERLRAMAVILTTVAHGYFSHFFPLFMVNSFTGVDMFFAISGFVVTLSFLRLLPRLKPTDSLEIRLHKAGDALKTFYTKRAFRILPLAFFWLFMYWLLSYIFTAIPSGGNFSDPATMSREVIAILSGFQNYLVSWGLTGNIGHFWSLCVEEQFYAILPLTLIIFITKNKRFKFLFILLTILIVFFPLLNQITQFTFLREIYDQRYFTLFMGVVLALLYKGPAKKTSRSDFLLKQLSTKLNAWGATFFSYGIERSFKVFVSAVLILVIWSFPALAADRNADYMHIYGFFVVGLFANALVYLASKEQGWILDVPILRQLLEYLGSRSYGIYLAHFSIVRLKPTLLTLYHVQLPDWLETTRRGEFLQYSLMWILLLIVSEICFRLIEKPMIHFGRTYIKYRFQPAVATAKQFDIEK